MKKFINWLKNPASDFVLFVILLILINLVGNKAFLRLDLTGPKSYSLSSASKQIVKTLDEPVSVQVFFSSNLPAPYNSIEQYISDILVEYKGAANGKFNYSFFDMDKSENQGLASDYGLRQVQIQEVANNEVGFKQAWMGVAVLYADSIKTIDSLTSSDGFEYKLTTTISKMISTADTLAALPKDDKLSMTLYVSNELSGFGIAGFDKLDDIVQKAYASANKKNMDRITYTKKVPAASEVKALSDKYGLQTINWQTKDGTKGTSILGIVLEHGSSFRLIPLSMQRSLFGYAIAGLDNLDDSISTALQGLVSKVREIGYVTGHDELSLDDSQQGAGLFNSLVSDLYTFKPLDLSKDDIPQNLTSLVINGPKKKFSDMELYKIDQFIMKGGNVMFFVDPFNEIGGGYYQQPQYVPVDTGLDRLFTKYGIRTGHDYILDENCYTQNQQGYGKMSMYWAPMLQQKSLDPKNAITKNLGYIIFLQNGSIDVSEAEKNPDIHVTSLAKSSPQSWLMTKDIVLNPMMITPPSDKKSEKAENLAVILEGKFESAFDSEPIDPAVLQDNGMLSTKTHLAKSILPGRIFISGSSAITGPQLIDQDGKEPVSMFIRNIIDYMNGESELCTMRTKGLSLNSITIKNAGTAAFAKYFNEYGLAILVALAGFLVWKNRNERRRRIHDRYNPDDTREISKPGKEGKK